MRQADWQVIADTNVYWFDPEPETVQAITAVSKRLLAHGAGYVSFDLMRTDDGYKIIEMNTCGGRDFGLETLPGAVRRELRERYPEGVAQSGGNPPLSRVARSGSI